MQKIRNCAVLLTVNVNKICSPFQAGEGGVSRNGPLSINALKVK
jgi:hypothetical protein